MSDTAAILQQLAKDLRACRGAFTMDYDGLPLDMYPPQGAGPDLEAIGAEMGGVLRETCQAAQDLGLGAFTAVSIRSDGATLAFHTWGQDCLLGVVLERTSSMGAARRLMDDIVQRDLPTA